MQEYFSAKNERTDEKMNKNISHVSSSLDAYLLVNNTGYNGGFESFAPNSGWLYDNRGGYPRTNIKEPYSMLNDVSDKDGCALIRQFNYINRGTICLETCIYPNSSGAILEFRDEDENAVYSLYLRDGNWCILNSDKEYSPILENVMKDELAGFFFRIYIDLDNKTSKTYIDGIYCGEHALLSDNILSFRFATGKKEKLVLTPGPITMTCNYKAYENFDKFGLDSIYNWETDGNAYVENHELWVESGKAKKYFEKTDGTFAFQTYFKNKDAKKTSMLLSMGEKSLIEAVVENDAFFVNGKKLYSFRYKDMWQRLRIEADTAAGKAKVLLNGNFVGEVDFEKDTFFDSVCFESENGMSNFDNVKVFNILEHDDYCPAPTTKAKLDDYIVGLNICSLWVNGTHGGWNVISPYAEHEPLIGYYDEGNPETADWEIKYMVEHGIDFQAFCWYGRHFDNGYMKYPGMSDHLHEAFKYAKYKDYMYYTLIWETWGKILSMEDFKNKTVPYWFENYFIDPSYLKIDNKVVFHIYAPRELYTDRYFGSVEGVKEALDYMHEVARSYGFDGMMFITSDVMNARAEIDSKEKAMGFDAAATYHWQGPGYLPEHNIGLIDQAEKVKAVHNIPTPSSGYDGYAWRRKSEDPVRRPVATEDDFAFINEWIKTKYLPKYENEPETWKKKMVMYSTWNEYGEGTFISPCGINKFHQLDAIAKHFPNTENHTNIVPTPEQRERINQTLLRRYGYYVKNSIPRGRTAFIGELTPSGYCKECNSIKYKFASGFTNFSVVNRIEVSFKGTPGKTAKLYFTTSKELDWSENKSFEIMCDSAEMKTYTINSKENYRASNHLLDMRLELCDYTEEEAKAFEAGNVYLMSPIGMGHVLLAFKLYINGQEIVSDIYPETFDNQTVCFPFDPDTCMDYLLGTYMEWSRKTGVLKISTSDHVAVYTVGSDIYTLDGKEKNLGYKLYLTDGIPMMDMEKLSSDFGFECSREEYAISIKAPQTIEFDESMVSDTKFDFSDFCTYKWCSDNMAVLPGEKAMTIKSIVPTNDPQVYKYGTEIDAEKYSKVRIKCRYGYSKNGEDEIMLFFSTNKKPNYHRDRCVHIPLPSPDGEWHEFTADLKACPEWKDIVTSLRFDPFSDIGWMEIEYMYFE